MRMQLNAAATALATGLRVGAEKRSFATSSYSQALQQLLTINRERKVNFGVENTQLALSAVGPAYAPEQYRTIHVTGTNGKGSVCVKLANALRAHGLRVGLFTSPHISTFRERIQVNGELISEQEVVDLLEPLFEACARHDIPATFFELTTLLGFAHFAKQKVDAAVIEVGLGGRLDSTNVIKSPLCSIITSIGIEHTQYLGSTVESIAREKCGIIKPGRPVVCGPTVPSGIAEQEAARNGSKLFWTGRQPLSDFDQENQRTVRAALDVLYSEWPELAERKRPDDAAIRAALAVKPPCRFERHELRDATGASVTAILDVGHNPQALDQLLATLRANFPRNPIRAVLGMSKDKDCEEVLKMLLPHLSALHLVQAHSPRAAPPETLLQTVEGSDTLRAYRSRLHLSFGGDVEATTRHAIQLCQAHNAAHPDPADAAREVLLICGTFFIMSDARKAVGIVEPRDPDNLNEVFQPTPIHKKDPPAAPI